MIKKSSYLSLLLMFLLLAETSSRALSEGQTQREDIGVQLRAELVVVPVQVVNKKTGRPAEVELRKEDFVVFEDGVPQQVSFFGREDFPLSVLLLIETFSRPEVWHYHEISQGVQRILERLGPEDEIGLMQFNGEPRLLQEFTKEKNRIHQKFQQLEEEEDPTKPELYIGSLLYTAIFEAVRYMVEATEPKRRRALVVFTYNVGESLPPRPFRGEPEVARKRRLEREELERKLLDALYKSDIVVCGVLIGDPKMRFLWGLIVRNEAKVDKLVEITGGHMTRATPGKPVRADQLVHLIEVLQAQYVLGYAPTNRAQEGKFHRIKVELSPTAKKKYKDVELRHRQGYIRSDSKTTR
jgi:VWFA-related protein